MAGVHICAPNQLVAVHWSHGGQMRRRQVIQLLLTAPIGCSDTARAQNAMSSGQKKGRPFRLGFVSWRAIATRRLTIS